MPSTAHRAHECAICRRSFLAGETVRLYRDHPSRAAVRVCELCPTTAEARGWMPAESTGRHLRMPADPGRLELAERRDALVERLTGQLATLEEELEQARGVREEADEAQAALSAAHGEIDRLTARLASTRNELEAVLAARHKEAEERRELKAALNAAQDGAPRRPRRGRTRSRAARAAARSRPERADRHRSPSLQPLAAPPAGARARDAGTGVPRSCSAWEVSSLPRRVFITFAFGGESRTFIVSLDLVARTASVARTSSDERDTATDRPARWSPDVGVELSE